MMPPQGQQQQEQLPMMDFQTDQMILGNAEQYMLTPDLQNAVSASKYSPLRHPAVTLS